MEGRRGELLQGTLEENGRRARYYTLTAAGRRQLAAERREWERSSTAVNWILDAQPEGRK